MKQRLDSIVQAVFGEESECIKNSLKYQTLKNDDSGNISYIVWSGSCSDIQKIIDGRPLNFAFKFVATKYYSLDTSLADVSRITEGLNENSFPDAEFLTFSPITKVRYPTVTIFGIVKFFDDVTNFSFTKEMPSPVENAFYESFLKICNLLGKDYSVYQFEKRNLLNSSGSYDSWVNFLELCYHEPCKDRRQLLIEIDKAMRLIKGKFRLHAMIAKERFEQGVRKNRSSNNV